LRDLGAIDIKSDKITKLGQDLRKFPVSSRIAKILLVGIQHKCIDYAAMIASILTVGPPFAIANRLEGRYQQAMSVYAGANPVSDILRSMTALCHRVWNKENSDPYDVFRPKAVDEIFRLFRQLRKIADEHMDIEPSKQYSLKLPPPTAVQIITLQQIILSGYLDHIAVRDETTTGSGMTAYKVPRGREQVFIHPGSSLFHSQPRYICYSELSRTEDALRKSRIYMMNVTEINLDWIAHLSAETSHEIMSLARLGK